MRSFDVAERRARLARRHRLATPATTVTGAVDDLVCLHATDPATVHLSVQARVEGVEVDDVEQALYADRTLVKHLAMRRTLWVFRSDDLGLFQAAASDRVAADERKRLAADIEKGGVAEDGVRWVRQAEQATLAALDGLGEATTAQLRGLAPALEARLDPAPGKSYGGEAPVAPRVLTCLSAAGEVVRASNLGRWNLSKPTWARPAHWLGAEPERPDEATARAELVRRWLRAFGPATEADVTWWLKTTVANVRKALVQVGAVDVDLDGRPGIALPDDLEREPPVESWAALLPGLDPTPMGWQERSWYLGPHKPAVFDGNGNVGPTAWWDGRIVGGWHQTESGEVRLQVLEDVGREATARLEAHAERLTDWLGGVRVAPRFPSPLLRQGVRAAG